MEELLAILDSLDIRLRSENGKLKCNGPTGAITPEIRDRIASMKEQLLEHLHELERCSEPDELPALSAVQDGEATLSYSQRRLLVLEELAGSGAAYILPAVLRLRGPLQEQYLRSALASIIDRHQVLRTLLQFSDGSFHGVVLQHSETPLRIFDLHVAESEQRPQQIQQIINQTITTPFDLRHEIPLRTSLLRLGDRDYLFVVAFHHSAADGWSIGIFQRELATAYNAQVRGRPNDPEPLTMQYADYAAWQHAQFRGSYRERKQNFWQKELQGVAHTLGLPTDNPRPALQTFNGSSVHFAIDHETTEKLKSLSGVAGATLFMTLLAGYGVFLSRICGQEDILAGIPMHNRLKQEFEPLIGYFSDTVPVRLRLTENPSFTELLDRVRAAAIGAYENQDIPFDELVSAIQPERDLSRNPLVQVLFALQNAPLHGPQPQLDLDDIQVEAIEVDHKFIRLDLEMHVWETDTGLNGILFFNTDLFRRQSAEKMCARYIRILQTVAAAPDIRIAWIPLIDDAEYHLITQKWNATDRPYSDTATLHGQFHSLAANDPDALAVVSGSTRLSRGELDALSDRIAAQLQQSGVQPGDMIGIFATRSWCSIAAMLAILKVNGVYVPLDHTYPEARLKMMVSDAGVRFILTEKAVCGDLSRWWNGYSLCVDREDLPNSSFHRQKGDPDSLCYLIYTSGSTGTPKGVRVRHRGVINMVEAICSQLQPQHDEVWTVFHSHSFDLSVWEIWGALLTGGTMVVVDLDTARNPDSFYELAVAEGVTILSLTPTALEQFAYCHELAERKVPLRHIGCGGESFPSALAARVLKWNMPLWNYYGPTEATVWTSVHRVTSADLEQTTVPIGRPFANMRMYIVDLYGNPLLPNTPGELCIGGVGVACGYHNRPELTAEKFTENPFERGSENRLYHTGDLARYAPDGTISVLGRMDRQAKLRGFRIELGEIEHALCSLPPVKQAVAVMRPDNGEARIVAYIVADDDAPADETLKMQLRETQPEYMIPQAIVRLDAFPVSHNGKVDVAALPEPSRVGTGREYKAPRTQTEKHLASMWSKMLGRERIGMDDNLFDIGATSLQVVQVQRNLQSTLSTNVVVTDFFRYPTIGSLAAYISRTMKETEDLDPARQRSAARRQAQVQQRAKQLRSRNV